MDFKLNVFDITGYFIPGAMTCLLVAAILQVTEHLPPIQVSAAITIVLIPVAYVAGFALYMVASFFSSRSLGRPATNPSVRFLDSAGAFTDEFRKLLTTQICSRFEIPNLTTPKQMQEAFELCYDYVIQKRIGAYTENFRALNGMCKSMTILSTIGLWLAIPVLFGKGLWEPCAPIGIVVTTSFLILTLIFWWGERKFAERFVFSVYRSFYTATTEKPQAATIKS